MHRWMRNITSGSAITLWLLLTLSDWMGDTPSAGTLAQSGPRRKPNVVHDIPYTKMVDVKNGRRQTLDLYLPDRPKSKPPLVIFIHGGFWTLSDDQYRIGPSLAEVLRARGVAVALVRYKLAPDYQHPSQAEDVAAAVAYLAREANKFGYDSGRIFLAGHSAGAHLAALVALDSTYLTQHGINPQSLAGVIAISGIYDLSSKPETTEEHKIAVEQAFGNRPEVLKAASPIAHVGPDAPPFLILTASSDLPEFLLDAKRFADALRRAGDQHVDQFVIPDQDHFSIVQLAGKYNEIRSLLLEFLKVRPLPPELALLIEAKRKWLNPPFSTLPFWKYRELIRSYPIDRRFVARLLPIYDSMKYELLEWPLEHYYAIDLFAYLDSLPKQEVGLGRYLIMSNVRNEKQFWNRKEVERYKPVIVIGIDDEKNLFRLGIFYRALREYSWKPGPRPAMMARPLGAFIHFLEEPPPEFRRQFSHYSLTVDSFQLVDEDPLASLREVPKEVYEVLTFRNGCIYCHSFRGIGSRSHHNLASTGGPHGGFALPLEEYPAQVWKAFMFNQREVAAKMGATPNVVEENARRALYELVVGYRDKQRTPTR
jgi:acetyl esterase/lipase